MSKYIHLCIFQFIVFLFQNPRETAMTFESIVAAIDTALTGWVEFDNDFYFNELVESGGISCFYFYPLFIVARLTTAIADKEDFADQLTHAHQLEEDLAWFVDSLRHTPNQDGWKELLQQVRIQVQEAADEVKNEGYEAYPGNPEQMDHVSSEKAHVEGKAASKAEDNVQNEEDEPVIKRMRFSAKTEIGESSMKEDGSSEERVILVNDEDNEEPAIKKMCLSSEPITRMRDGVVKGTESNVERKREAGGGSGKKTIEPALKRMRLSEKDNVKEDRNNKDKQETLVQEKEKESFLMVRLTCLQHLQNTYLQVLANPYHKDQKGADRTGGNGRWPFL